MVSRNSPAVYREKVFRAAPAEPSGPAEDGLDLAPADFGRRQYPGEAASDEGRVEGTADLGRERVPAELTVDRRERLGVVAGRSIPSNKNDVCGLCCSCADSVGTLPAAASRAADKSPRGVEAYTVVGTDRKLEAVVGLD